MTLYNDFKKQKSNKKEDDKKSEKVKEEKKTKDKKDETKETVEETKSQSININDEIYEIQKEPIYKRKEFYVFCSVALIVIVLLIFLLYVPSFKMEDLTGKDENYAQAYSKNYNLEMSVKSEFNDNYSLGQIFDQSLTAGSEYKEGSVLQISVSKGPDFELAINYPDFGSMTYQEAVDWKRKNYAKGTEIILEYNNTVEKDGFIKEDIGELNKLQFKRSSEIKIYFSQGKKVTGDTIIMQDLSDKTVTEAADWAYAQGLKITVKEIFDDYLSQGIVLDQNVAPGEKLKKGESFEITISVGPGVIVPNFTNVSQADAMNVAGGAGLTMIEKTVYHASVSKGKMISQCTPAGTKIRDTDIVTVTYSLGKVPIGDFTGITYLDFMSEIDALNENNAKIKVKVNYVKNEEYGKGIIISQTYINTLVKPGSTITINVTE